MYFRANWIKRGFNDRLVICQKLPAAKLLTNGCGIKPPPPAGFPNCAWLNRLKNSARNWRFAFSRILMFFITVASKLNWPGPSITPSPELPQGVPLVTVPSGATAQTLVAVGTPLDKVQVSGIRAFTLM